MRFLYVAAIYPPLGDNVWGGEGALAYETTGYGQKGVGGEEGWVRADGQDFTALSPLSNPAPPPFLTQEQEYQLELMF